MAMNCMYIYVPYRSKVQQPDALQHNVVANSEMEIKKQATLLVWSTATASQ